MSEDFDKLKAQKEQIQAKERISRGLEETPPGLFSERVLLELIWLVKLVLTERDDSAGAFDRLSTKVDELRAEMAQMETRIMGQFESLTADVADLKRENAEIVEFINTKAGELADAIAANEVLTAKLIEQEPNLITQADRDELAANQAEIRAVKDSLNNYTPGSVEPPADPGAPTFRNKKK